MIVTTIGGGGSGGVVVVMVVLVVGWWFCASASVCLTSHPTVTENESWFIKLEETGCTGQ